ncbi:hypothetical protein [Nocardia sp. NPDC060249]|uniref:hypothetical protein n=1 Tax=Nocardia sp. NPDC060249 TaxID=3347082 RepID=UPI00366159F0
MRGAGGVTGTARPCTCSPTPRCGLRAAKKKWFRGCGPQRRKSQAKAVTAMPDRDIVDAIDELVDWQMSNHANRSGYDHNVNQATCPHTWCDADWHGLAITLRMHAMRSRGRVDPDYRYDQDDSEVLCPGSGFVGEFTPPVNRPKPGPPQQMPTINELLMAAYSMFGDLAMIGGLPDVWNVPDDPMNSDAWLADAPRWWRCDDTTGVRANVVDLMRNDFEDFHAPDRVGFWNHRWVLVTDREEIELYADRENPNPWNRGVTPGGRPWLEIYTSTPPSAGVWRPVHGVVDLADITALQNLRCTTQVGGGIWVRSDIVARQLQAELQRAAREHLPGTVIHLPEMVVSSGSPTPSEAMADRYPVTAQWVPQPVGGVLEGGHAHGRPVETNVERVETVAPAMFSLVDWRDPRPTVDLMRVTYERAAYDTVTRRWVYRPRRPAPRATVHVRRAGEDGWQELGTTDATAIRFTPGDQAA